MGAGTAAKTFGAASVEAAVANPVERYMNGVIIHGTAESVLDQIQALRSSMNLESLMVSPLSQDTFQRFTDKVLPKLI